LGGTQYSDSQILNPYKSAPHIRLSISTNLSDYDNIVKEEISEQSKGSYNKLFLNWNMAEKGQYYEYTRKELQNLLFYL